MRIPGAQAICLVLLIVSSSGCMRSTSIVQVDLPEIDEVTLEPCGRLEFEAIRESSGIVKSRMWPDVFWTHNDSGDTARIFAVQADGKVIMPRGRRDSPETFAGIEILDAVNVDWEDIAADDRGNLLIGAFGNNCHARRDLAVYMVPEPEPTIRSNTRALCKIGFHFPDQTEFPDPDSNFNVEALFHARGKIYIIARTDWSKAEGKRDGKGRLASLYRMDATDPTQSNVLPLIARMRMPDGVSAADASPDGRRLAVLTYSAVWLFEKPHGSDNYFRGRTLRLPVEARQSEAICFDGSDLLITNEQRDVYRLPVDRLIPVGE